MLQAFHAWAPNQTVALQQLVARCRKASNPTDLHDALVELCNLLAVFKSRTGLPELRPAWELTTVLEGLSKQLARSNIINTPSTLRTLEEGVSLLADLCASKTGPVISSETSIKILAVDDDEVARFALTSAIKRAFEPPDLAPDGQAALALVKERRYDLIILDVMMPGMDGFEVCAKIRETIHNRATPVLFITALNDFDSHSKSLVSGGNELMGKPFMAFEVTVKAMTLVLRSRLRQGDSVMHVPRESASHSNPAVSWPASASRPEGSKDEAVPAPTELPKKWTGWKNPTAGMLPEIFNPATKGAQQLSKEFLEYMPRFIAEVKEQVALIEEANEATLRKEMAVRLHLRLKCLSQKIEVPQLRPAFEICRSLEGLFKKFEENTKHITETSLGTANAALDLLGELCRPEVRADLTQEPPIRLLVVDDEPVARKALTGALQMSFLKPLTAESAEAALELSVQHAFDLVFMDVCLPVADGFTACSQIHEIEKNRTTPVVFVTSLSDEPFRKRARDCGGSDFVVKPFLFVELNLKALTIVLRGRLAKEKTAENHETATSV